MKTPLPPIDFIARERDGGAFRAESRTTGPGKHAANGGHGADAAGAPSRHNGPRDRAKPPVHFRLIPFDKIVLDPSPAYLVRGIIPCEGLVVIWGAPKCGKSFWAFDLVMHVALGWEYRGRRVKQGAVIYVACEGERGLGARAEAFRRRRLAEESSVPGFHLLATRLDLVAERQQLVEDIRTQFDGVVPVAIVIDTLNRSIAGSESSDEDMGNYVKAADAIREAFRCAVLIIHHCGIDDKRPRGHTSLTGAADAQIAVRRDVAGLIIATVEYLKDGAQGEETRSSLEVVELGQDADGENITSCVVDAIEGGPIPARRARQKVTGPAKVALDLLRRAVDDAGESAPASNHVPQHVRVVDLSLWRQYAYEGSVTGSDKPDAKRKAFDRAVTKLQSMGLVGVWGSFAWLTE
jgi:hypothetical protein